MSDNITVVLVDDHAVVRAGFSLLLSTARIDVIAEAQRGEQAVQLYEQTRPDVVVMDLSMPGIGGLEAIRRICSRDPQAKILVFSIHDEGVYAVRALRAGARGYITKSSAPEIIAEAVTQIAEGHRYIEATIQKRLGITQRSGFGHSIDDLSDREFDIFRLIAKGQTTREIASELCLANKTVANYSTQIKAKLNVSTTAEIAQIAISTGVVKSE